MVQETDAIGDENDRRKMEENMDYKSAGVDIEAGYQSVELLKKHVKETMRPEVLGGLGGFSGAFCLDQIKEMEHPVLLSGTDGVGTKIKLAFLLDKHDTVGIDCVAMCVNDVACAGGEPLFFLDYIACGRNFPEKIAAIVGGVAEGCKQAGAALIGGETAEHPGLMPEEEYDLAGFAVGVVDQKDLITGEQIRPGDVLVGIASSGVHSNEGEPGHLLRRAWCDAGRDASCAHQDLCQSFACGEGCGRDHQGLQSYYRRRILREYSAYAAGRCDGGRT